MPERSDKPAKRKKSSKGRYVSTQRQLSSRLMLRHSFKTELAMIVIAVGAFMLLGAVASAHPLRWNLLPMSKRLDTYMANRRMPATRPAVSSIASGAKQFDVPYCNQQKMDIYHPRIKKYIRNPVVIYIHGGGFVLNTKSSERDQLAMLEGLRDEGFTMVSIDYRMVPEHYYPEPVEDALCAVRYLRAHARELELDSSKFALYGFSAGGYLASMVGLLPNDSPFEKGLFMDQSSRVQAVVTLAGLFDFEHSLNSGNIQRLQRFMHGVPLSEGSSVRYVTSDDPPFLLIHGLMDQYVPVAHDGELIAALDAAGVAHERILVQHADHGLNPVSGELSPSKQIVRSTLQQYIISQLFKL